MQLTLPGLCWAINLSPFGLFVSFLIVSLVPAREHVLPGLFSAAELAVLDPTEPAAGAGEPPVEVSMEDRFDAEELSESPERLRLDAASSVLGGALE